jgi:hypothetical protein
MDDGRFDLISKFDDEDAAMMNGIHSELWMAHSTNTHRLFRIIFLLISSEWCGGGGVTKDCN